MSRRDRHRIPRMLTDDDFRELLSIVRETPREPPLTGIFAEPLRCYVINEEWSAHIAGAISWLAEPQAWIGASDETHFAVQSILQFLRGDACVIINCDDVENCLQISDTIDALSLVSYSGQRNVTADHQMDLLIAYDGTAQSIGSVIPTGAVDENSLLDNALCAAITSVISVYAATKAAEISLKNGVQGWYQDVISAMRVIAPILPDWLFYLLGDELFGCVADFNAALVVLTDPDAKLDFACCLRNRLRVVSMTQAGFDAAVTVCAIAVEDNAHDLACLFEGDNSREHYLSFLETYNTILVRQAAGEDFACLCAPPGWFFQSVDWGWIEPTHAGNRISPVFSHVNPLNGRLFAVIFRFQTDNPPKSKITTLDTGLSDALVIGEPLGVSPDLWLFENSFVGIFEGADAIDWPDNRRKDVGMRAPQQEPGATLTYVWKHLADLGHEASALVSDVRLLYKKI